MLLLLCKPNKEVGVAYKICGRIYGISSVHTLEIFLMTVLFNESVSYRSGCFGTPAYRDRITHIYVRRNVGSCENRSRKI